MRKASVVATSFLLTLAACQKHSSVTSESANAAGAETGITEQTATGLAMPELATCLADWKAVAIQGCVAIAESQMSDEESLLPDYRKALSAIKARCSSPRRIEWIAEQAARETIKSLDSYGGAGQQPPTVPQLCASNVTYRGKSEGYDMRVWNPQGLANDAARDRKRSEAAADGQLQATAEKQEADARKRRSELFQSIILGQHGSWVCLPAKKAGAEIEAIVRDTKRSTNPIFVKKAGKTYSGSLIGQGWMYEATVRSGQSEMSVQFHVYANDDALTTKSFAIKANVVGSNSDVAMTCSIFDD